MPRSCTKRALSLGLLGLLLTACSSDAERTVELAAQGLFAAKLSRSGDHALVGSLNHGGSLWRTASGERLYSWNHSDAEFSAIGATALAANSPYAITADPRTLVLWNMDSGNSEAYWATPGAVHDLALSPDGSRVLMGLKDHSAILIDCRSGDHLQTLLHEGEVTQVALSGDGQLALTASEDATARLWNLNTGQLLLRIDTEGPIRAADLSSDGRWLLVASRNAAVDLIDVEARRLHRRLHKDNPGIVSAHFSENGLLLGLGQSNRVAEVFSVESGARLDRLQLPARPSLSGGGRAVLAVAFDRNGGLLTISGDGHLNSFRLSPESARLSTKAASS